ncbi:hypothetical protein BS333_21460 (plasmid) [Vibrio azureus]|uniref:Type II secretion system protein n=1 Tax=Vibrio azureus NBRC 104587 TaxID=1219077 RepID=U3A8E5_9VIBR|nr:hypothetical protein [Vibrio azureus]AUI88951.1 hypothetical protein BS333_21460 [Vibrio azureus]GAD76216.1 hypothetical protein VAZ01S_039_00410 [Vibrio azureus NBRC 104587]
MSARLPTRSASLQRGSALIETILALSLILALVGISLPFLLDQRADEEAQAYGRHIRGLIERIHQYQYYKITELGIEPSSKNSWPQSLSRLMTDYRNQYWNSCSTAQERNGDCVRPDYVPWSNARVTTKFRTAKNQSHLVLRFPLSSLARDPKSYHRWAKVLIGLPGAKRVGHDIEITLRQATLAMMYENILMRDGNVELKSDWDVGGNHAISNVRDVTIKNSDGTTTSVVEGLVNLHSVKPWDTVPMPSCPRGLRPDITLSIGQIDIKYPYVLTGSVKPYVYRVDNRYKRWTVSIDAYVTHVERQTYHRLSRGEIVAITRCKK